MSIFKKNKKHDDAQQHSPQADAKNLEYVDGPANPKDVGHAAPGAPMNQPSMPSAQDVVSAPAVDRSGSPEDESERRDNVEPI